MNAHRSYLGGVVLAVFAYCAAAAVATGAETEAPKVNYVSAEAVYLNVGRHAGLEIGARVEVVRNGRTIAVLEVVHVSSNSSSCRIVEQSEPPRVGDAAVFSPAPAPTPLGAAPPAAPPPQAAGGGARDESTENVVSGYVEFQNVWQRDMTGSDLTSLQPAVTARVLVKNVGGSGGELRFRDRIRYYDRDRPAGPLIESGQWYHRLTELAFVADDPGASIGWGVGRLVTPYMIGVGFVDGGYVSLRLSRYLRAGAAAGFSPDPLNLAADAHRTQAGGYLAFDYESPQSWRLTTSAALAGMYRSGTVSREFVYWQNLLDLYRRLAVFQSAEIDLNRNWRREAAGEAATLSNFFVSANAELAKFAALDFSYDARQNVRVYETRETPDSLFDDVLHDGYRGGVTFRLPQSVVLRGYGGIRYRDGERTNRYFTIHARAARLPWAGHVLWVRYSYADARTLTGHRPAVEYHFPAGRRTRVDAGVGGYIYERATRTTSSAYADLGAYYSIGRYFASGKFRQYVGGDLDSILLFAEFGVRL
jgi:hypothetical protein